MILSFHPCFESDTNIICAGRLPGAADLAAIQTADAIILPQGCKKELFEMANNHCKYVFPDYRARFQYAEKIGQIKLFEQMNVPHPKTIAFKNVKEYLLKIQSSPPEKTLSFPLVFKFNWGGEGETVFLVNDRTDLEKQIQKAELYEKSDQKGFMLQEYIPSDQRVLRVVVIGSHYQSYWRIQKNPDQFTTNWSSGARIDHEKDPDLRAKAVSAIKSFCHKTNINLAGFDFLFAKTDSYKTPLFLEINYFFGRSGLGGSEKYYQLIEKEIQDWLDTLPKSEK
jgi:ribosomal protein S6--L-glutamate ligase